MSANKYNYTEEEIKDMVAMYKNYESINTIANKYCVDGSVIKSRLISVGVIVPSGSPYSVKYWIGRGMTLEQAKKHLSTLRPVSEGYWLKLGYSIEDSKLMIEGQKLVSLRGCIARFGEIEGTKIWDERAEKRSVWGKMGSANIEYWLKKGYSEDEAKLKLIERQRTFTLEKCIIKYGELEGTKLYNDRQSNWQQTLYRNGKLKAGYSNISQELFSGLTEYYDVNDLNYVLFAKKGGEFVLRYKNGFYHYDFADTNKKKIIEYNGDMFHGNPIKYNADDCPNPFLKERTAKEIWEKDERKLKSAEENGFDVLVVWDSDYTLNPNEVINRCRKFLNI